MSRSHHLAFILGATIAVAGYPVRPGAWQPASAAGRCSADRQRHEQSISDARELAPTSATSSLARRSVLSRTARAASGCSIDPCRASFASTPRQHRQALGGRELLPGSRNVPGPGWQLWAADSGPFNDGPDVGVRGNQVCT